MDARGRLATSAAHLVGDALHAMGRAGSTAPGRIGLAIDHGLIAKSSSLLRLGSIAVCGTNGKTTTNNMIARALEESGFDVACNSEGANMAPGIASALVRSSGVAGAHRADWGCFEVDEFSAPAVVSALQPRILVLLNLFRDQLDRYGEIDIVIERLAEALRSSPQTIVAFNADDPLASHVASFASTTCAYGVEADLGANPDPVVEGRFCLRCGSPLSYARHSYGQLGDWRCIACGNARMRPDYVAEESGAGALAMRAADGSRAGVSAACDAPYLAYDILAAYAASALAGVGDDAFSRMLSNRPASLGRMERFCVGDASATVNLAKNPTGFNQSIDVAVGMGAASAIIFVVNSNANDGYDVSWLWDVDFERLSGRPIAVYAAGTRANDVQVRLKYASVDAPIELDIAAGVDKAMRMGARSVFVIANYSALASARNAVARMAEAREASR